MLGLHTLSSFLLFSVPPILPSPVCELLTLVPPPLYLCCPPGSSLRPSLVLSQLPAPSTWRSHNLVHLSPRKEGLSSALPLAYPHSATDR